MKQKTVTLTLFAVIICLALVVITGSNKNNQPSEVDTKITFDKNTIDKNNIDKNNIGKNAIDKTNIEILYWGTTCPNCYDTIEWIEENKVEEKLTIIRKEVDGNQDNAFELSAKAMSCGLDEMVINIPLMYTSQGECLTSKPDITKYLEKRVNQVSK